MTLEYDFIQVSMSNLQLSLIPALLGALVGGAGFLMTRALNNLDYNAWQQGVLIVLGLALLTDLVFGLIYFLVGWRNPVGVAVVSECC
jgi:hypothetical protein